MRDSNTCKKCREKRKSSGDVAQNVAHLPQVDPEIIRLGGLAAGVPELARLVESWPKLPAAIRRAILALVGSAE
jgi:hypothetical protein